MNDLNKDYTKTKFSSHMLDLSGDYILPDSFKDVKTVLSTTARITELNKYFGPTDAQMSGNVVYDIIFTTSSEDGKDEINAITFNESFKQNCKYVSESNTGAGAVTLIEKPSCRMANPRKFSVKSSLKTTMFEDLTFNTYPSINGGDDADMEYKIEISSIPRCFSAMLTDHSFSDNVELDIKMPEIDKLVNYDVKLHIKDESNGKSQQLKLGGIFLLNVIYLDAAGNYQFVSKDIPFNISLNQDEMLTLTQSQNEITGILPSVTLTAVNLNIGKNQYDEAKIFEFDADYDIDMLVFFNRDIAYVTDAYSTKFACEATQSLEEFLLNSKHLCINFTNTDNISKAACGIQEQANVECLNAGACVSAQNERIDGKMITRIAYCDDKQSYRSQELISDFSYKTDMPDNCQMIGNTFSANTKVRSDNEKIYTDSEIYMDYIMSEKAQRSVCAEVTLLDTNSRASQCVFSIYFPNKNDTLWDCAKTKMVSMKTLSASNPTVNEANMSALIIE